MIKASPGYLKPAFLFLLAVTLNCSARAQTSIPFKFTNEGHILVRGKINGVDGTFMFDTGAGMTIISKKFSLKVDGLAKQEAGFTGLRETGEPINIDLYEGKSLTLNSFAENAPVIGIVDVDFGLCDGVISLKSFSKQPFTIDYAHQKIIFETERSVRRIEKTGKIIPLQLEILRDKTIDMFAYFKVNNVLTLQFHLDSGAGRNVYFINTEYLNALGIDTLTAKKRYKPSEFNPNLKVTIYVACLKSIAVSAQPAIKIENIKASFIPGLIYDGKVSLNWIGEQITFDLKKSEMIVL